MPGELPPTPRDRALGARGWQGPMRSPTTGEPLRTSKNRALGGPRPARGDAEPHHRRAAAHPQEIAS
eukprot:12746684-Alexandrium_andersonii.AAC.1